MCYPVLVPRVGALSRSGGAEVASITLSPTPGASPGVVMRRCAARNSYRRSGVSVETHSEAVEVAVPSSVIGGLTALDSPGESARRKRWMAAMSAEPAQVG